MFRTTHGGRVLVAAMLAASLLAPLALAQAPSAKPSNVDLTITLNPDGTATANVYQTWIGASARAIRQSLDVYFGAADGTLTDDELRRIAEATQVDMVGQTMPWISSNGQAWIVSSAKVTFDGAAGRVTATTDMSMRHELVLTTGGATVPATIDLDAPWPAVLHVVTPEGFAVKGGAPETIPENARTTLTIVDAASAATPEEVPPEEAPPAETPPAEEIPPATLDEDTQAPGLTNDPNALLLQIGLGVGGLLLVGIIGVIAWLYLGNRKKKRMSA